MLGTGSPKPELSFNDFMDLVLSLRSSNVATVLDMTDLRKSARTYER